MKRAFVLRVRAVRPHLHRGSDPGQAGQRADQAAPTARQIQKRFARASNRCGRVLHKRGGDVPCLTIRSL
jgi:hypothetical protein